MHFNQADDHKVWEWGSGGRQIQELILSPTLMESLKGKHVTQISSGKEHTLFLNDLGQVFQGNGHPVQGLEHTCIVDLKCGKTDSIALDQQGFEDITT